MGLFTEASLQCRCLFVVLMQIGDLNVVATDSALATLVNQQLATNERWINRNQKVIDEWIEKNGAAHTVMSSLLMLVAVTMVHLLFGN